MFQLPKWKHFLIQISYTTDISSLRLALYKAYHTTNCPWIIIHHIIFDFSLRLIIEALNLLPQVIYLGNREISTKRANQHWTKNIWMVHTLHYRRICFGLVSLCEILLPPYGSPDRFHRIPFPPKTFTIKNRTHGHMRGWPRDTQRWLSQILFNTNQSGCYKIM